MHHPGLELGTSWPLSVLPQQLCIFGEVMGGWPRNARNRSRDPQFGHGVQYRSGTSPLPSLPGWPRSEATCLSCHSTGYLEITQFVSPAGPHFPPFPPIFPQLCCPGHHPHPQHTPLKLHFGGFHSEYSPFFHIFQQNCHVSPQPRPRPMGGEFARRATFVFTILTGL